MRRVRDNTATGMVYEYNPRNGRYNAAAIKKTRCVAATRETARSYLGDGYKKRLKWLNSLFYF